MSARLNWWPVIVISLVPALLLAQSATAPLPRSGQSNCFDGSGDVTDCATGIGAGQEGHIQPGIEWPIPRFTKNGDGTVTDNLTGLVWL